MFSYIHPVSRTMENVFYDGTIKKYRLFLYSICVLLAIIYSYTSNPLIGYINIFLILFLLLKGSVGENFSVLFGLQFLDSVIIFTMGGSRLGFMIIAYLFLFYKYVLINRENKIRLSIILPVMLVLSIETFHLLMGYPKGDTFASTILWMMNLLYFSIIMQDKNFSVNYWENLLYFFISLSAICLINIISEISLYGEFGALLRFGSAFLKVGGPNGIAFQTSFIIALSYIYLIRGSVFYRKIITLVFMIIFLFFGALTISRGFYIEIALLLLLIIFSSAQGRAKSILNVFFLVIAIIFSFYIIKDLFPNIFELLFSRFDQGNGDRNQLLDFGINLFFSNIWIFILGAGIFYPTKYSVGLMEQYTAHNLFLDSLLSLGIIGSFFLYFTILKSWLINKTSGSKFKLINYIPLIMLLAYNLISGSTRDMFLYFYLILCIKITLSEDIIRRHKI